MSRATWTVAFATLVMGTLAAPAAAMELRVPQDFRTIRKAVKQARPGDTIVLAPRTYRESVVVKVPGITILGNGAIWKPKRKNKRTLTIRADDVTVTGIVFWSGGVRGAGDDLAIEHSNFQQPGSRPAVDFVGDGARVDQVSVERHELGKRTRASISVKGDDAVVRGTSTIAIAQSAKAMKIGTEAAVLQVTGSDAVIEGNQVNSAVVAAGIRIVGDDARVESNDTRLLPEDGLVVIGDRAQIDEHFAGNVQGTAITVEGTRASVTECGVDSSPDCIAITGNGAVVTDNDLRNGTGQAIRVDGDEAQVEDNDLRARFGEGVTVNGDDFEIVDNVFEPAIETDPNLPAPPIADPVVGAPVNPRDPDPVAPQCPMIVVRTEEGGQVVGNQVEFVAGTAIHVEGNEVRVAGNTAIGTQLSGTAIVVQGNDNVVIENQTRTVSDFAIDVTGDSNMVCTNALLPAPGSSDRSGVGVEGDENVIDENVFAGDTLVRTDQGGDGFVIAGNRNEVVYNEALDAAGNGFLLERGSGNEFVGNVAEDCVLDGFCLMNGADNLVDQCRATGSWGEGLDNRALQTDVVNSWFRNNGGGDLVNTGTFDRFGSNQIGNAR